MAASSFDLKYEQDKWPDIRRAPPSGFDVAFQGELRINRPACRDIRMPSEGLDNMAINLRRIWVPITIALVVAAGPIAFLDYFLPHHSVLRVVGTDIKRTASATTPTGSPYDVRYIYTEDIESKKPRVFRNEDTGWGFPWYMKFNSSDVQAAARSIANEGGTAAITYYGWRIQIFSLYPNVVKIKRAEPDAWIIPWFNIAFFTVVIGGGLWLTFWVRGIWHRRRLARDAARGKHAE
jgi:hypothetical protein